MAKRLTPMEPGERDRKITIQQLTESIGGSGFPVETWTTLTSVYARKEDLRATERAQMDQLSVKADTGWEVPYRADLDPDLWDIPKTRRLLYKSRVYDITGASIIGRNEGVELITIAKAG